METFILIEFIVLGLIIFMLSIYPDRQVIIADEMDKFEDLKKKLKETNEKLQNQHRTR